MQKFIFNFNDKNQQEEKKEEKIHENKPCILIKNFTKNN